jgi:hypothetical protein
MSVSIPALKSIRIFVSYSSEDKKIVGSLKDSLEKIGFEVFLAHEDIKPGLEWPDEIVRNLKSCHIFVPFLTKNFGNSEWTDQETGMAFADGKLIISLQVDVPPYGFIGKKQGLKICKTLEGELDFDRTAEEITKIIINDEKFRSGMKEFVISNLINSQYYREANARVIFLEYFEEFTDEEVNRICEGAINSNEICGAFTAQRVLREFIDKYRKVIKPGNYETLKEALLKGYVLPKETEGDIRRG